MEMKAGTKVRIKPGFSFSGKIGIVKYSFAGAVYVYFDMKICGPRCAHPYKPNQLIELEPAAPIKLKRCIRWK